MSGGQAAYPAGSVTDLIDGDRMTPKTSAVLRARMGPVSPPALPVLDAAQLAVLSAVAARLVPQGARATPIDLAGTLHRRLADGVGDGWRYADLPGDAEAIGRGLAALDAMAPPGFTALDGAGQDAVLRAVQSGHATGAGWDGLPPARWFEELLAMLVDIYYSHPLAQEEIGFLGMADARGWQDVGLGARRDEPEPLR